MSDTAAPAKKGRLRDLQKLTREREEIADQREQTFLSRVAMHQFMNHNAPIFQSLARTQPPDVSAAAETIREAAENARRLAVQVAARVLGKEERAVDPADVKPFRTEAATLVVELRASGSTASVTDIADAIAAATKLADPKWDFDAFRDLKISADGSVAMTAAAAVAALTRQVMVYDFRRNPDEVLGRLANAVTEAAATSARQIMPADSSEDERRMMLQSLTKHLAGLMDGCYERHARNTVASLSQMSEKERVEALNGSDPIGEIVADFNNWAIRFGGFTLAAARDVRNAAGERAAPPVTPNS